MEIPGSYQIRRASTEAAELTLTFFILYMFYVYSSTSMKTSPRGCKEKMPKETMSSITMCRAATSRVSICSYRS